MVRKAFEKITAKIDGLHKAVFWLASFSVLSQILAFLRDRLLAFYFGAGESLDIYYTAFRIPDFIFVTFGSLVSISVLVPLFSKKAVADSGGIKPYIDSIFTNFFILIVSSCVVAFIFMPELVHFLFRGFSAEDLAQIIKFSRILLLSPLLLGFSNFFGSIVQYEKRFLLYSLSPLFYNFGIIIGTVFGAKQFGIIAVVGGVVFGALFHLLIPAVYVACSKNFPKFTTNINQPEVKETVLISIPRALALSVTQIINIIFTSIASFFGSGAIAVFSLASNLQSVPLSIIGASYSLAAFPTISEHYARKNITECGKHIGESLRFMIFWLLPISALFIILRTHIVRTVLGSGAFDWTDTKLTAAVLSIFALSFVFQSIQLFLTRAHYALGRTKIPLLWGISGVIVTVFFAFAFRFGFFANLISFMEKILEIKGLVGSKIIILPAAFSIGTLVTALGLWSSLPKEIRKIAGEDLPKTVFSILINSLIIGFVTFYSLRIFDHFFALHSLISVFGHAFFSGMIGIFCGVGFLLLSKNREAEEIISKFRRKLKHE